MKAFLKVLLIVAAILLVIHFWPIALLPLLAAIGIAIAFGSLVAGVLALLLGVVLAVLLPVAATVLLAAVLLSPIWIPVVLIAAIVKLSRSSRTSAPA